MKLFMQTRKSAVLMMAQVVENMDNLISSHDLACGQEVWKSGSNRGAGIQPTQQVHRSCTRSRQPESSVRCFNRSRRGRYAKHCYQAIATMGNSESQIKPPRRQNTEVP